MSFSFSELKKKAGNAKDASVNKFQNTRDRMQSTPLKSTNWDPYNRKPTSRSPSESPAATPPPVAPRHSRPASVSYKPPPPPARHSNTTPQQQSDSEQEIDWSNLSAEDKETFFSWLDEFFTQYLGRPIPAVKEIPKLVLSPSPGNRGPPPPIAKWNRPQ